MPCAGAPIRVAGEHVVLFLLHSIWFSARLVHTVSTRFARSRGGRPSRLSLRVFSQLVAGGSASPAREFLREVGRNEEPLGFGGSWVKILYR